MLIPLAAHPIKLANTLIWHFFLIFKPVLAAYEQGQDGTVKMKHGSQIFDKQIMNHEGRNKAGGVEQVLHVQRLRSSPQLSPLSSSSLAALPSVQLLVDEMSQKSFDKLH